VKIISLDNLKALCKITFTAQDTALTLVANGVEADVEKYLDRDLDTLTEAEGSSIQYNLEAAAAFKWQDSRVDIWEKGVLARALYPLRLPGVGVGSTS
jgi:hypothetical protein